MSERTSSNPSTLKTKADRGAQLTSRKESSAFKAVFQDIVRELMEIEQHAEMVDVFKRYEEALQYNVPNGKQYFGLGLVNIYRKLESPDKLTPENVRLSCILGWCGELLFAASFILDDIADHGEIRRDNLCWYKKDGIGLSGINDANLLLQGIFTILKRHFSGLPCYVPIIELIHETILKVALGQVLDMLPSNNGKPIFSLYSVKQHKTIVYYKTVVAIQMPVLLALYMVGQYDSEILTQAKDIMEEIGHLYQVQDDYLDHYGDTTNIGKIGSDIPEGRCTWFIVEALRKASPKQRAILEANFARSEPEAVQTVRDMYEELDILNSYRQFEEETCSRIKTRIGQLSDKLPRDVFLNTLNSIYQRSA